MFILLDGGSKIINTDRIQSVQLYIAKQFACIKMMDDELPIWVSVQDYLFLERTLSPTKPSVIKPTQLFINFKLERDQ